MMAASLLLPGVMGWAQGTIDFSNSKPPLVDAPIVDAAGQPVGSAYRVGAYLLHPGGEAGYLFQASIRDVPETSTGSGYFQAGVHEITGVSPASSVTIEVRAWPAHAGSTYEQALANGAAVGRSAPITVIVGGPVPPAPPRLPPTLLGLQGFQLSPASSPRYRLTQSSSPAAGGSIVVHPPAGQDTAYDAGTMVTLTATSADGYAFAHWSGAASGTSAVTQVTLLADAHVVAHFNLLLPLNTIVEFDVTPECSRWASPVFRG